jgi:hypothetical protein
MLAPCAAAESNLASRNAANVSLGNRAWASTSAACFAAMSAAIAAVLVMSGLALTDDRVVTPRRYHQGDERSLRAAESTRFASETR